MDTEFSAIFFRFTTYSVLELRGYLPSGTSRFLWHAILPFLSSIPAFASHISRWVLWRPPSVSAFFRYTSISTRGALGNKGGNKDGNKGPPNGLDIFHLQGERKNGLLAQCWPIKPASLISFLHPYRLMIIERENAGKDWVLLFWIPIFCSLFCLH